MNISTYIFGSMGNGYSQYPNDYAQTIFQSIYTQSSAPTQIVVHREDKLIYYAYVRKLEAGQYIGLCVVLNSVMLTDFKEMFSIFENLITSLVVNGIILQFNDKGDIVSKASQLYTNQAEVSRVTDNLRNEFSKLENTSKPLPPVSYGIAKNEKKTFSIGDNMNDIIKASVSFNYTFIVKQKDFDTQSLSSYRGVVSRLNKEKSEITQKYIDLQKEHAKVLKKKKQFQLVVFLGLAILACGVGLFFLNDNLNTTKSELAEANYTISIRDDSIKSKDSQISDLHREVHNLNVRLNNEREQRENTENEFSSFKSSFSSAIPILITDIEIANVYNDGSIETSYGSSIYSSNSMYLKPRITYIGIRDGESITLYARLYGISGTLQTGNSSPSGYSFSNSMTISSGEGIVYELSGWGNSNKGHWKRGSYRYEIWYEDMCLKSKSFTIY